MSYRAAFFATSLMIAMATFVAGHAEPQRRTKPPACHRTKWRLIDGERVPWDHDAPDHEWDEFEHSVDECVPPPC